MPATLTKRILFCWHAVISVSLAASTLLMTLTLTPAFAASNGGMSCCPNGSSTHCSSGMKAVPEPEPEPEPTCGHEASQVDEDTIVAEPENENPGSLADNSSNQISQPSFNAPCGVDCCTFAWSSFKRSNRDLRGLLLQNAHNYQVSRHSKFGNRPDVRHTSERFYQSIPRGPPPQIT